VLLVRNPNLVAYWRGETFVVEDFVRRCRVTAAPRIVRLLDAFSRPTSIASALRSLSPRGSQSLRTELLQLRRWGFLGTSQGRRRPRDVAAAWKGCFAAAHYHFATRDVPYRENLLEEALYLAGRTQEETPPSLYKQYRRSLVVPLLAKGTRPATMRLSEALRRRRTVRAFSPEAVPWAPFAAVLAGTWGQTGWIDGGFAGKLLRKTSPSAGARHPIECYVVASRVAGLKPGVYHYSVKRSALEGLRTGKFRDEFVRLAGNQEWIANAAFLCVMTAATQRVFWKYTTSDAYRLFLLDAGHLAQTFCLLATAHGLGPFTTAALNETRIERLLGVDGVREISLYICGAGVPQ
jgi:SagB-type dehydrogenase family enzyme